jgi:carboxyl-terminal processing protease
MQFKKFAQYFTLLENKYYDSLDISKIIETAIKKSLEELDPHSSYLEAKESNSENDKLKGNFEGVGISFRIIKDTLNVLDVIAQGPSEKVGISIGDKLILINDSLFAGSHKKDEDYISRLRGKKGTAVNLTMLRRDKLLNFKVIRDIIPLNSVDIVMMLDANTGYIKINKFSGTTEEELISGIKELQAQGMKQLILDLQNNSGGYLNAAVGVVGQFVPMNELVVFTKGLNSPKTEYRALGGALMEKGKLIILINENSASASEIVAGAIQDLDRGMIIGRRSFGKGLVQNRFTLIDKSELRLTTAEYFTPTGRLIQKPFVKGELKEYRSEILDRAQKGILNKKDTFHPPDSLMKLTKNKRKVFGGGGIMPDIYVPIDTMKYSDLYFKMFRKNILNDLSNKYGLEKRDSMLVTYPTIDDFIQKFSLDASMKNEIKSLCQADSIEFIQASYDSSARQIDHVVRANIARGLYGSKGFYRIINQIDDILIKALAMMKENFTKYKIKNE